MKRVFLNSLKVIAIFIFFTGVFFYGLKMIHLEYKQLHKYDEPEGPAVKAFQIESSFIDRLNLFFRLGE